MRASGTTASPVDAEGHIADRRVGEALMGLKRICPNVPSSGPTREPVWRRGLQPRRHGTSDKEFTEAADWLARSQDGRV